MSSSERRRGRGAGRRTRRPGGERDRGFVTAEAAVALPVLVLVALGLLWGLMVAAAQIQCVDAARAGARAAARQEPAGAAAAAARQAAPPGARVSIRRDGELVRVRVDASAPGPGAVALRLHHEAVAFAEDAVGAGAVPGPRDLDEVSPPGSGDTPGEAL